MRIFVAIPISEELGGEVERVSSEFSNLGEGIRWIRKKNLHTTLVPPFEVENAKETINKLNKYKSTGKPVELLFKKIESGPNKNNPRLIWAVGSAPKDLVVLSEEIHKNLGFEFRNKNFLLHMTIARFNTKNKNLNIDKIKNINIPVKWTEKTDKFVLMRSHLLRAGAEYEVIKEFKI